MRTKSSLEFSFVGKAKIQKKFHPRISSHIIDILFLSWRVADFKSRYKCETRRKRGSFEGECYEKALSGTDFVQWYQIQNLCVDGIKK